VSKRFGDPDEPHTGRHRLTSDAVRDIEPACAVVLGCTPVAGRRQMLQENRVRLHVAGATFAGPLREHGELWEYDITERILAAIWRRTERADADSALTSSSRSPIRT
jgi:hypothetical protein